MSENVQPTEIRYEADRPAAENPIKIMDLSFRDGHQSLFATRGRTQDMIPVAEMMDEVGFWAVETWGGATFDTMHRFLNEDPWERIRTLKRYFKKTPFSMLLRGQNLVGYRNYADDVAKLFVKKTAENGMEIFRTFDALNDYRNFETVVPVIKECGAHFQGCICYTMTEPRMGGEVYNIDYYVNKAKDLEAMGADSICLKDMAGLLAPYDAYDLVKGYENYRATLHGYFPSDKDAIDQYLAKVLATVKKAQMFFAEKAVPPVVSTLFGGMMRRPSLKEATRTTRDVLPGGLSAAMTPIMVNWRLSDMNPGGTLYLGNISHGGKGWLLRVRPLHGLELGSQLLKGPLEGPARVVAPEAPADHVQLGQQKSAVHLYQL